MKKQLHIVCLDVPFPADYGGAIDMMNRIILFKQLDIAIHLHYFSYNDRGMPNELNQYCETISVYERKKFTTGYFFDKRPYIVSSRINQDLITNLNKDNHPIFLEGIHCTGILPYINRGNRRIVVRMHNDESIYYKELARATGSIKQKLFFNRESRRLKKYADTLPNDCLYACVSEKDIQVLQQDHKITNTAFIPTFPTWQEVNSPEGMGSICLYHGNLSVPENEEAAMWLLCRVFSKVRMPFVIAGKKPGRRLIKAAELCQHTCLIANPSESEMNDLIRKAHIHVLPSFNKNITGIRLKLLHALFEGRHCVVNTPMVAGTGLDEACHIAGNSNGFASIIAQLYHQPFAEEEIKLRKRLLGDTYSNEKNTRQLIEWLW